MGCSGRKDPIVSQGGPAPHTTTLHHARCIVSRIRPRQLSPSPPPPKGCDCLGPIYYFDALLSDSKGNPKPLKHAVCMHEEDYGLLWKHVEYR